MKILLSLIVSVLFSTGIWNDAPYHRNGLLLVEVLTATVEANNGAYDDQKGWYIAYDEGFQEGDKALSILVYNPFSNDCDDIIERYDINLGGR